MFKTDVIHCRESWHFSWWGLQPKSWGAFGWHVLPYDAVVFKSLNLGPLSIHNDWKPVESMEPKSE